MAPKGVWAGEQPDLGTSPAAAHPAARFGGAPPSHHPNELIRLFLSLPRPLFILCTAFERTIRSLPLPSPLLAFCTCPASCIS